MDELHCDTDERVRALRRRALLAERLLVDLGSASDPDVAAGMLVQALTAVAGSRTAELHALPRAGVAAALAPDADAAIVVLARATNPRPDDDDIEVEPSRHHAIDAAHGLELIVEGEAVPPVAVDRALGALSTVLDRIAAQRTLLIEARTDVLTGLLNRRAIDERIEAGLARIERRGGRLSLLVLDLDGFKQVNDTHGHAAGDVLLQRVATAVQAAARTADDVGRLGGDEFALLLPDTSRRGAVVAATRLGERLGVIEPSITASIGIATVDDGPVPTVGELLGAADRAMYAAKRDLDSPIVHADDIRVTDPTS